MVDLTRRPSPEFPQTIRVFSCVTTHEIARELFAVGCDQVLGRAPDIDRFFVSNVLFPDDEGTIESGLLVYEFG